MKKVILTIIFSAFFSIFYTNAFYFENDYCFNVAINMYDASIDAGLSKLRASQIADHFYDNCMSYF